MEQRVFVAGGTGYMGRELIPLLVERGHQVRAVVRKGSEAKVKGSCEVCTGNVLDGESYREQVTDCDTFIHLVGVPHPSPPKRASLSRSTFGRRRKQSGLRGQQEYGISSMSAWLIRRQS